MECFSQLGKPQRAQTLLKSLWQEVCSSREEPSKGRASFSTSEYTLSKSTSSNQREHHLLLLWRIFLSSSLTNDIECLLQTANALQKYNFQFASLANTFALLQGGRPSAALDGFERVVTSNSKDMLWSICKSLYKVDAKLETETRGKFGVLNSSLCEKALTMFHRDVLLESVPESTQQEFLALLHNNCGISQILDGNMDEAVKHFQSACEQLKNSESRSGGIQCGLLQPYFNLALVYWRERRINEAIDVWSTARGFPLFKPHTPILLELEELLDTSMQAYFNECRCQEDDMSCHVSAWGVRHSPARKQLFLMDCIVLQSAVQMRRDSFLTSWTRELTLPSASS